MSVEINRKNGQRGMRDVHTRKDKAASGRVFQIVGKPTLHIYLYK